MGASGVAAFLHVENDRGASRLGLLVGRRWPTDTSGSSFTFERLFSGFLRLEDAATAWYPGELVSLE